MMLRTARSGNVTVTPGEQLFFPLARHGFVMSPLRVALLGAPVIERGGTRATFDTRKAVALLALLAVSRREHSRERLTALFWPESGESRARSSLRRTLSVTHAAVGDALVVTRNGASLDLAGTQCDVWEFERLAAAADASSLEGAASLYRDDFLAGFSLRDSPEFDDWQRSTAEHLRARLGQVLGRLVEERADAGVFDEALGAARRWLALDPLNEPAHQALVRCYAWTGQRSAALAQYRSCVRVLERELGVAPLATTTALYEDVRANRLGAQLAHRARRRGAPTVADRPPLLGQESVLATLLEAWQRVGPAGRLVAVAGEAGAGKSRIVEELARRLGEDGAPVISVRCHEGEAGLALGLVTELLRSAAALRPDLAARVPPHDLIELSRLVPGLAVGLPDLRAPQPLDTPGAQARLYRAVGDALASALGDAGAVVVDDVHFADDGSAQLLAFLVRRLAELPLLVVLTWERDAGPPEGLRPALNAARRTGEGKLAHPRPLGAGEAAVLLDAAGLSGSGIDVGRLVEETRGLPLLLTAYVDALRSAEVAPGEEAWLLPASVRELLRARLANVSETAAQALAAAAVLGGRFDAELLRRTSGRREDEAADALEEALGRGLLEEHAAIPPGDDATYDFAYDALRRVVYEDTSGARRRLLHGRAAEALGRRHDRDPSSAPPSVVAGHFAAAGRADEAATWSWRAATRARALFAHAEALNHLRSALELGHPPPEARAAIGDVLIALGRYEEARVELEHAAAARDPADPELAAVEHRLAEIHHRLGDWALADAHLVSALDLAGADPVLRARVRADRALVSYRRGGSEAGSLAARALAEASACGDPAALAQALDVAGMLAAAAGDLASGEEHLRSSLHEARRLSDPAAAVAALNNLSRVLALAGRTVEALDASHEALALGTSHGDRHRMAALHTNLADLLHATGDEDGAMDHLKSAASLFARVDAGAEPRPEVWTLVEW